MRDAIHDAVPLRQCSDRLSVRRVVRAACVLAGIGRCSAPCEGGIRPEDYAAIADLVAAAWTGDVRPLVEPLQRKIADLSAEQRFEQAADRARPHRHGRPGLRPHAAPGRPARRGRDGRRAARRRRRVGTDRHPVRTPRAAGSRRPRRRPWPVIDALVATADVVDASHAVLAEETECVLRWLEEPGVRLVRATQPWAMPAFGAGSLRAYLGSGGSRPASTRSPTGGGCRCQPTGPRVGMTRAPAVRHRPPARSYDGGVITAIVMVSVESDKIPEVAQAIADLDGVSEVYSVAGRRRPHRDRAGAGVRPDRRGDRRAAVEGARRPAHRHPHRVPRVLAPRPRGRLLDRLHLVRLTRTVPGVSSIAFGQPEVGEPLVVRRTRAASSSSSGR